VDVPAQLSVVGFDDTYVARIVWPPLTTVHQPTYDLAYAATDLLMHTLRNQDTPKSARLPYRLVIRDSTGPVASS
jgi:LacI family transcriptional regulator